MLTQELSKALPVLTLINYSSREPNKCEFFLESAVNARD